MKSNTIENKLKKDCCACTACINLCPKNAISMEKDEFGNLFPIIDKKKCTNCGLCEKTCAFKKTNYKREDKNCYAAYTKKHDLLLKSSSGGIFSSLAEIFLNEGGYVCGCALNYNKDEIKVEHIIINDIKDLYKLQGSKYVQSNLLNVMKKIKELLNDNKKVLFSGTPCQVAGLKSFLRKDYDNLYTIDIICHGAPSTSVLRKYIKYIEKKNKIKVKELNFRNKEKGWGLSGYLIGYKLNTKKEKRIIFSNNESSYYYLFQKGFMYRENCYSCPYASDNRPGDITIGDYWGIEKEHPELLEKNKKGISCLIVNNNKGEELLDSYGDEIYKVKSSFEKIQRNNDQLQHPTIEPKDNKKLLELYKNNGYAAVEKEFVNIIGKKTLIKNKIKNRIKQIIKNDR